MPVSLYARSLGILTFLFGMFFVFGTALIFTAQYLGLIPSGFWWLAGVLALLLIILQFLISPILMDIFLPWIYRLNWYDVEELPAYLRDFIREQEKQHKFNFKHVGIIEDNNPNAFTYGHFKKNARLVLTRGILTYLNEDEQIAVVGHEIGHVVHRDFVVMTIAAAVPLVAYTLARGFTESLRSFEASSDDEGGAAAIALFFITAAIMSYLIYWISHYLVLFLSRTREYYADEFSAKVTGAPGNLSSALVKVAYGLFVEDSKKANEIATASAPQKRQLTRRRSFDEVSSALGIFDLNVARGLSLSAMAVGKKVNEDTVAAAASWDLYNPWAKFLELQSTHPLPGKRLRRLDQIAIANNLPPKYPDLGKIKPPESLWDEFIIDLFLLYVLPYLIFILPPLFGIISVLLVPTMPQIFLSGLGLGLAFWALLWFWRIHEKYPKVTLKQPVIRVADVMSDMSKKNQYYEASPIRGKPIALEGKVVGRGIPGYWLSEDMVIQDDSGLMTLDVSHAIPFLDYILALFRVPKYMGEHVVVFGWYRRAIKPYVQVWKIYSPSRGKVIVHNRWAGLNKIFAFLVLLIGLAIFILFFPPALLGLAAA